VCRTEEDAVHCFHRHLESGVRIKDPLTDCTPIRYIKPEVTSSLVLRSSEDDMMNGKQDPQRNDWFHWEPDATPGLSPLDGKAPYQTDLNLPDTQKKEKEVDTLFDPQRENLQMWASKGSKERIFICAALPKSAYKRFEHIKGLEEDLHMTLLYVPQEKKLSDEKKNDLLKRLQRLAKKTKPVECKFTGIGTFNNGDNTLAAFVNVVAGSSLYGGIVGAVEESVGKWEMDYGYLPHVTLKYKSNGKSDLKDFKPFKWTMEHITVKFSDEEQHVIELGTGETEETLKAVASLKLTAAPETYTSGSDINQTKEEFDNRALMFRQEDHLDVNNGRDGVWGEPTPHDFVDPAVHTELDEQIKFPNNANVARSALKLESWRREAPTLQKGTKLRVKVTREELNNWCKPFLNVGMSDSDWAERAELVGHVLEFKGYGFPSRGHSFLCLFITCPEFFSDPDDVWEWIFPEDGWQNYFEVVSQPSAESSLKFSWSNIPMKGQTVTCIISKQDLEAWYDQEWPMLRKERRNYEICGATGEVLNNDYNGRTRNTKGKRWILVNFGYVGNHIYFPADDWQKFLRIEQD
jgi:2'-5' RNA ligase